MKRFIKLSQSLVYSSLLLVLLTTLLTGCALKSWETASRLDNRWESIIVDDLKRTYILHVPPAAEYDGPLPLLIVLHGTYSTGRKMQLGIGFDPYADERGFYVAYPNAYQAAGSTQTTRWNDGRETLESSKREIDDVRFVLSMIEDIATKVPLDKSRVYVTGASNGGMMVYRLGCETSGVFAGIAPIADACFPQASLSFLSINGDVDPFVPIERGEVCREVKRGCEKGFVISTEDSVKNFDVVNGCGVKPQSETMLTQIEDRTFIEKLIYPDCAGDSQVNAYIVHGGGHTWAPRSGQLASSRPSTQNLDATKKSLISF